MPDLVPLSEMVTAATNNLVTVASQMASQVNGAQCDDQSVVMATQEYFKPPPFSPPSPLSSSQMAVDRRRAQGAASAGVRCHLGGLGQPVPGLLGSPCRPARRPVPQRHGPELQGHPPGMTAVVVACCLRERVNAGQFVPLPPRLPWILGVVLKP